MNKKFRFISTLGIILWLALSASIVWADGETGTVTGYSPGTTVQGTLDGSSWSNWGGTIYMELSGGDTVPVFCTDIPHHVGTGDTFVASDEEMDCRVKWLMIHYPPRSTDYTPWPDGVPGALNDRNNEIAARQAAVWHFSDGLLPDESTTVGARAWDIINVVPDDACAADAPSVTITPASAVNPVGATQAFTVTVTRGGDPVSGQVVNLSTDVGTLSTSSVTTNGQGQATFTLTHDTPDTTSNIEASAEMPLPVGTIFVGVDPDKQKLVLGQETSGTVYGSAVATWTGTGTVTALSFDDYDMDGTHDSGEPLLEGWTVRLYKYNGSSWNLLHTQTTDEAGTVLFTGISAGSYRVVETLQSGWYNTTVTEFEFTLETGGSYSAAFGQVKLPVIVGHVFQDDDLDGSADAGEPALAGWELRLYRMDGSYIVGMQGVTGDDGTYIFSSHPDRNPPDIEAGDYYVQETLQDGWYATTGISQTVTVGSGDVGHAWLGNIHPEPALTLDVSGPAEAHEGDTITYDFSVTNDGNVPLENVTVNDPLLGGEVCDLGTLDVGATDTCSASYTIPTGADDPLVNSATASGTEPYLGGEASDSDSASTDILHPPVAEDDSDSTAEDTPVTVDVLANDSDPDGDSLTVDSVTQPAHGTVTNNGTDVTYTPDEDYNGDDSFTYTISDGNGGTDSATVTITVTPVNDPPDAVDDSDSTAEDTPVTVDVLANDSDPDGDSLTVTEVGNPDHGSVVDNGDGTVTYTPDEDYNGDDSFTYTISDGNGGADSATVTITVTPVNDPPDAVDDSDSTAEDTPVTVDVLANDSDPDGDSLTVTEVGNPDHGSVVDNGDGTVTYTPDEDYNGDDSFTYTISDGNGGADSATATITVTPVNDPPDAVDDSDSTAEDTPVTVDVLANDSDVDGDSLTIESFTQPAHGTVTLDEGGLVYTPEAGYSGTDSFTYTISDGNGGTDSATVTITVLHIGIDISASGPAQAHEGDTITYTVTVTNTGDETLDVVIPLPGGGEGSGGDWTGTLLPGESAAFEATTTAEADDFSNTFTATGTGTTSGGTVSASDTVDTEVLNPALELTLTPSANEVYAGEPVVLTYEATNTSNDTTLYDVVITSDNGTPGDTSDDYIVCTIAELGAGETQTCEETVNPSEETTYTGTAEGHDALGENVAGSDSATTGITSTEDDGDTDTDGDGVPDYLDTDSDGDGIPDNVEGEADLDNDGMPNYLDTDSDGDGIPDSVEWNTDGDGDGDVDDSDRDVDNDGIPNFLDTDSDGDGILDSIEWNTDGDGDGDVDDSDRDIDGDGIPNFLDTDSDGDGILDSIEWNTDADGDGDVDGTDRDADGDGIPNFLDTDSDGDGILDSAEWNTDADGDGDVDENDRDADGDGIPNFLDTDSDGDGIPDILEWNTDADGDGDVDENDRDADGDGIPNYLDLDSDGDGIPDVEEGTGDDDGDGIPNYLDPTDDAEADDGPIFLVYIPLVTRGN